MTRAGSIRATAFGFGLLGLGLLALASWLALERQEFLAHAEVAEGVVEHLVGGGSHPRVGFVTHAGEHVLYPQGGLVFGYRIGQPVRVFYLPEQPARTAVIEDRGALWGMPVLLGVLGLAFVGAAWADWRDGARMRLG